jgi:hypothetical protein
MSDTNVGPSGFLTPEGRVANAMSSTRNALMVKVKALKELDAKTKAAHDTIESNTNYRSILSAEVDQATTFHQAALKAYTNSPWMDIQVKPAPAPDVQVLP